MTDSTDQPAGDSADDSADDNLDVGVEQKRLDDLGGRIDDARHNAEEDLEPGHAGRMFADESTERLTRNDAAAKGDVEAP